MWCQYHLVGLFGKVDNHLEGVWVLYLAKLFEGDFSQN